MLSDALEQAVTTHVGAGAGAGVGAGAGAGAIFNNVSVAVDASGNVVPSI